MRSSRDILFTVGFVYFLYKNVETESTNAGFGPGKFGQRFKYTVSRGYVVFITVR